MSEYEQIQENINVEQQRVSMSMSSDNYESIDHIHFNDTENADNKQVNQNNIISTDTNISNVIYKLGVQIPPTKINYFCKSCNK
jgi:competence protein ComGF